jgi:hypothetical protein
LRGGDSPRQLPWSSTMPTLTEKEIEAAALADPDARPLAEAD